MLHEEGKRLIVVCDAVSAEKDGRCKARNDEQGRKEKFEDCGNQWCLYGPSHVSCRERSLDQKEVGTPVTEAQYKA